MISKLPYFNCFPTSNKFSVQILHFNLKHWRFYTETCLYRCNSSFVLMRLTQWCTCLHCDFNVVPDILRALHTTPWHHTVHLRVYFNNLSLIPWIPPTRSWHLSRTFSSFCGWWRCSQSNILLYPPHRLKMLFFSQITIFYELREKAVNSQSAQGITFSLHAESHWKV